MAAIIRYGILFDYLDRVRSFKVIPLYSASERGMRKINLKRIACIMHSNERLHIFYNILAEREKPQIFPNSTSLSVVLLFQVDSSCS